MFFAFPRPAAASSIETITYNQRTLLANSCWQSERHGGPNDRALPLRERSPLRFRAVGLHRVWGRMLSRLLVPIGVHPLLRGLRRELAGSAMGTGASRATLEESI